MADDDWGYTGGDGQQWAQDAAGDWWSPTGNGGWEGYANGVHETYNDTTGWVTDWGAPKTGGLSGGGGITTVGGGSSGGSGGRSVGGGGGGMGGGGGGGGFTPPTLKAPVIPTWEDIYKKYDTLIPTMTPVAERQAQNANTARFKELSVLQPGLKTNLEQAGNITTQQLSGKMPFEDQVVADISNRAGALGVSGVGRSAGGLGSGSGTMQDYRTARNYGLSAAQQMTSGQQSLGFLTQLANSIAPFTAGQFMVTPDQLMARDITSETGQATAYNQNAMLQANAAMARAATAPMGGVSTTGGRSSGGTTSTGGSSAGGVTKDPFGNTFGTGTLADYYKTTPYNLPGTIQTPYTMPQDTMTATNDWINSMSGWGNDGMYWSPDAKGDWWGQDVGPGGSGAWYPASGTQDNSYDYSPFSGYDTQFDQGMEWYNN